MLASLFPGSSLNLFSPFICFHWSIILRHHHPNSFFLFYLMALRTPSPSPPLSLSHTQSTTSLVRDYLFPDLLVVLESPVDGLTDHQTPPTDQKPTWALISHSYFSRFPYSWTYLHSSVIDLDPGLWPSNLTPAWIFVWRVCGWV